MGYHLNRLDEPVFMAVSKPLLTGFGIHHRLESCERFLMKKNEMKDVTHPTLDHDASGLVIKSQPKNSIKKCIDTAFQKTKPKMICV